MQLALIHDGRVHAEATEADRALGVFDIRDVSGIAGIAIGWLVLADGSYEAPSSAEVPVVSAITYKADLYRRCSDAEAEAIEAALAAAPIRERRLFETAQYLSHGAAEFATMRGHLDDLFGAARAAILLAPSA